MEQRLIIVVGTTPDYVTKIQEEEKTKPLLFLLDSKFKDSHELALTENSHLIFSDLENFNETLEVLKKYLSKQDVSPCFACFDCETLYLASRLAENYNAPFPKSEAVLKARNKFVSSRLWMKHRVFTPECGIASNLFESLSLFKKFKENVVLKPLTGSGSELVFHCTEEQDIIKAVEIFQAQLKRRRNNPLFALIMDPLSGDMIDPCSIWIVEEYIDGPEYSCDFFMDKDMIRILRETGKIKDSDYPFGTVSGYTIPPYYPDGAIRKEIKSTMKDAASALGFTWGFFMADFIVSKGIIHIIELTPRPGGDSLPELIKESTGADILKTYLDSITGDTASLENFPKPSGRFASVHLFSDREGIIDDIDTADITSDPRTRLLLLKKNRGDSVSQPPDDYDNRLVGYCIISQDTDDFSLKMCKDIQRKIKIKYTNPN
ncbi:MAG: ATP-grasp domain-containing protein [Deltaproteobacteria bacterium]|nr:ATP-grasp domain-containing protein [Deltaproteobacteria bacterium]